MNIGRYYTYNGSKRLEDDPEVRADARPEAWTATRAERVAEFARLRGEGNGVLEAGRLVGGHGVSAKTARAYERARLAASGEKP